MSDLWDALTRYLDRRSAPDSKWADVFPFVNPNTAASSVEIALAEQRNAAGIPDSYRRVLEFCNGSPSFFQSVDLLSTHQLGESPQLQFAHMALEMAKEVYGGVLEGITFRNCFVFGVSTTAGDIFFIHLGSQGEELGVVWFNNEIIEVRGSMVEFVVMLRELL